MRYACLPAGKGHVAGPMLLYLSFSIEQSSCDEWEPASGVKGLAPSPKSEAFGARPFGILQSHKLRLMMKHKLSQFWSTCLHSSKTLMEHL